MEVVKTILVFRYYRLKIIYTSRKKLIFPKHFPGWREEGVYSQLSVSSALVSNNLENHRRRRRHRIRLVTWTEYFTFSPKNSYDVGACNSPAFFFSFWVSYTFPYSVRARPVRVPLIINKSDRSCSSYSSESKIR